MIEKEIQLPPNNESDATRKYFMSIIQKIYDESNAPAESLVLDQKSSNEFQVTCLPCSSAKSKIIGAGCKTKSLSNLKAHLKTPSHKAKAANFSASRSQPHTTRIRSKLKQVRHQVKIIFGWLKRDSLVDLSYSD